MKRTAKCFPAHYAEKVDVIVAIRGHERMAFPAIERCRIRRDKAKKVAKSWEKHPAFVCFLV